MKITIISGSPRKQSVTVRVARFLMGYLKTKYPAHEYSLIEMSEHELPFVQKVWSTLNDVPEQFKAVAQTVFESDAFILLSPEYNGGYSTALKNLLDHFPKQAKKVFGIVTASPGALGGMRAAQQLQNMICGLFGVPSPNMLIVPQVDKKFNPESQLVEDSFSNSVHTFANEFVWLAEAVYNARNAAKA